MTLKKVRSKIFDWITDFTITSKNFVKITHAGRARWKIENETFNTLKNQGYQFEHNFGHGKKYLTANFSVLMILAFLIDQIQQRINVQPNSKQVQEKHFGKKLGSILT